MLKKDHPLNKIWISPCPKRTDLAVNIFLSRESCSSPIMWICSTIQNALDHCILLSLIEEQPQPGDSDGCVNDLGWGREWATGTAAHPQGQCLVCATSHFTDNPARSLLAVPILVCMPEHISTCSAINKVEVETATTYF